MGMAHFFKKNCLKETWKILSFSCTYMAMVMSEDTRLLHEGKYHHTSDLLFYLIGFNQTSKSFANVHFAVQLSPKQTNWRCCCGWIRFGSPVFGSNCSTICATKTALIVEFIITL